MKGLSVTIIALTISMTSSILLASQVNLDTKPVIVLCAFGTSTKAIETYEYIQKFISNKYPEYQIKLAYTSNIVLNKLKESGVICKTLSEVYEDLRKEGKTKVVVQSLHIVPGQEFHQKIIMVPSKGLNIKYGYPLLSYESDFEKVYKAIEQSFAPENEAVTILCGHGNDKYPEFNASLVKMDEYLRHNRKNTFLATVEGQPGTENAFEDAKISGLSKVHFVPFMLVAGDHVINDVMGDEEDSWKNQLKPMEASVGESLGYNEAIIQIVIEHIDRALEQF